MQDDSYTLKLQNLYVEVVKTSATVEVIFQMLLKQNPEDKAYWLDHRRRQELENLIFHLKIGGSQNGIPETLWGLEAELIELRRKLGLSDLPEEE